MRDIVSYVRAGSTYIAFDASGRAVGIVTDVKRNMNAKDSKQGLQRLVERQGR